MYQKWRCPAGHFKEVEMSPERDANLWMALSGGLLALWSAMLSYTLRAFGQRMDKLEHQGVPKPECTLFRSNNTGILSEIKQTLAENSRDIQQMKNAIVKIATKMEAFLDEDRP